MANRTSSAAIYSARTLMRVYDFAVIPPETRHPSYAKLQPSDIHIAIFIDYKTNIKDVANIRAEIWWWQDIMKSGVNDNHTAQQLLMFIRKVIGILDRVPHFSEEETPETVTATAVTTAGAFAVRMNLSKASLEAMECLFYYYAITPKNARRVPNDHVVRRGVASTLEGCLQVAKAMRVLPLFRQADAFLSRGQATAEQLAKVLERAGTLFEFLPSYDFEPGTFERDEDKLLA